MIGAISGVGTLQLQSTGVGQLAARLSLRNPPESVNLMQLGWTDDRGLKLLSKAEGAEPLVLMEGTGACSLGDVRVDFAETDSADGRFHLYRVTFLGQTYPALPRTAFGYYQALIKEMATGTVRHVSGYWRNVPEQGLGETQGAVPADAGAIR